VSDFFSTIFAVLERNPATVEKIPPCALLAYNKEMKPNKKTAISQNGLGFKGFLNQIIALDKYLAAKAFLYLGKISRYLRSFDLKRDKK